MISNFQALVHYINGDFKRNILFSAQDATTSTGTSSGVTNAIGAIAVGGVAAYILSQVASGQNAQGMGSGFLTG